MALHVAHAPFDLQFAQHRAQQAREFVDELIPELGEKSHALFMFITQANLAAAGLAQQGDAAALRYLIAGSRAAALMFVHGAHPDEETAIEIVPGAEAPVIVAGEIDTSLNTAREWLDAMWSGLASGDLTTQRWLAIIDTASLAAPGTQVAPHVPAMVDLLRALAIRNGGHAAALAAAIRESGATTPAAEALRDWTEEIDVPALKAVFALLGGEAGEFDQALANLLNAHRARHARGGFERSNRALVSLPACALRRLAAEKSQPVSVTSDYMPELIWAAPTASPVITCPYCVYPKPPDAPRCALCGEETHKDAPLEFPATEYLQAARRPCPTCQHTVPKLAVRCPKCRTPIPD